MIGDSGSESKHEKNRNKAEVELLKHMRVSLIHSQHNQTYVEEHRVQWETTRLTLALGCIVHGA